MRIIISPAKKMNVDRDSLPVRDLPVFLEQAEELCARLRELTDEERVEEIARILGGIEVTAAQRDAAREMIAEYRKGGTEL